ncbi:MAG: FecR domain-containing protein [Bacteroidetes bacterium]|nr:FecR domain-containing protein [Bacteroidota bacterium]
MPWIRWAAAIIIIVIAGTGIRLFRHLISDKEEAISGWPATSGSKQNRQSAYLITPDSQEVDLRVPELTLPGMAGYWQSLPGENGVRFTGQPENSSYDKTFQYSILNRMREVFVIELPDKSRVLLLPAASVEIPVSFNRNRRELVMEGEAFFDIRPDAGHPFTVVTRNGTHTTVLGTRFNLCAYKNETDTITLVEGLVSVSRKGKRVQLIPGQQAVADTRDSMYVKTLQQTESVIAWTKDSIICKRKDIRTIILELCHTYHLRPHLTGVFSRDLSEAIFSKRAQTLTGILSNLKKNYHFETWLENDDLYVRGWKDSTGL